MRNPRRASQNQLLLELELPSPRDPLVQNPKGLVEALADLLLAALAQAECAGGADERQDHA